MDGQATTVITIRQPELPLCQQRDPHSIRALVSPNSHPASSPLMSPRPSVLAVGVSPPDRWASPQPPRHREEDRGLRAWEDNRGVQMSVVATVAARPSARRDPFGLGLALPRMPYMENPVHDGRSCDAWISPSARSEVRALLLTPAWSWPKERPGPADGGGGDGDDRDHEGWSPPRMVEERGRRVQGSGRQLARDDQITQPPVRLELEAGQRLDPHRCLVSDRLGARQPGLYRSATFRGIRWPPCA
jgi:hypothetical protein